MPNFGTHLSGPLKHKALRANQDGRAWYSNLPIGMNDPDYVHLMNDFLKAEDYTASSWTLTLVGTGTAAVNTTSQVNGILALTTTAGGTDSNNLQSKQLSFKLDNTITANTHPLQSDKKTWLECSFSVSSVADVDAFVGLSEAATDVFASNNYAGFRITNGSGLIACQNAKAGTQTSVTTAAGSGNSVSATAGTLVKVGFLFDGANSIKYYINRNLIQTVTTNIPTADMALTFKIKSNSANARAMNIDYVYACKSR